MRKWSDQGRVPAFYTPGGHRRYRRDDLEAFLAQSGPTRRRGGPPVLLVDDDERMRALVRVELERQGYEVQEAPSADAGLAAIEARKPELILLDVMMPHVDGWEMLRRIQERHGVGAIPVLMFSGQVDEGEGRRAASGGARGFVGKGFDLDQLVGQAKAIVPV